MNSRILQAVLLIILCCSALAAQNLPSNCPTITIETPKGMLWPKRPGVFTAHLSGTPTSAKLSFWWASTLGTITGNFGSPTVHLVTQKKDGGTSIVVFVRVEGLPQGCPNIASEVIDTGPIPIGEPVDVFGILPGNDVKARMDSLYVSLRLNPTSSGLIDLYFSQKESNHHLLSRIDLILAAIRFRKYDVSKISFAFIESAGPPETKLWIVPTGADVLDDRPGAVFIKGEDLMKNPRKTLPKRQCLCK